MTAAGQTVKLKRYRTPTASARCTRSASTAASPSSTYPSTTTPVYLVERHVTSQADLHGLATEYAQRSETCGIPAILAILRTADELADAIA